MGPGQRLGRFEISTILSVGSGGTVYRAFDPETASEVAIKTLVLSDASDAARRRFEREALAMQQLDHPSLAKILGFGVEGEHSYIAMELLPGATLRDVLDEYAIGPVHALRIVREILGALAHAHERGVVHRDLKPSNVLLVGGLPDSPIKLLDFGLAKVTGTPESEEVTLTRTGTMLGSLPYMSPEQVIGRGVDARADIYAVGILLHELLTDRHPFPYERRSQIATAHLTEALPPLTRSQPRLLVVPELQDLVHKATQKEPSERYQSAREMLAALDALPPNAASVRTGRR